MIPRGVLSAKYIVFVALGLSVYVAASPSVNDISPDWFTPIWGLCIAAPALVAAFATFSEKWETLEFWALAVLVPCLVAYPIAGITAVLEGDKDRLAFSIIAIVVCILPGWRLWMLVRELGKKHE